MRKILLFLLLLTNFYAYTIVNGDIEILRTTTNNADKIFINQKQSKWIPSPVNKTHMIALVSSNYRNSKNIIVELYSGEDKQVIEFELIQGDYKKEQISVEPSMSSPSKENQERINKEASEAYAIYAQSSDEFLFDSKFEVPMNSFITSNFGNARLFNGSLKSYHSGTDFRAAVGTPIKATNDGIVRLAKDRYYAGGSVILDHGAGIYSQYYHLSQINTKSGDRVKKGDILGLSGATGRVSGPHLHFGIMVNGNSVEPLKFIEKINYSLFDIDK
ncbi:MAG: M23 family metallopeptidase [Campylobacter sp.]|nr:M23 family metallopeptidase [Campylobacter sp.]